MTFKCSVQKALFPLVVICTVILLYSITSLCISVLYYTHGLRMSVPIMLNVTGQIYSAQERLFRGYYYRIKEISISELKNLG